MAADIDSILRDIESCYDFAGKSVVHVGAGGGQLIGYAARTRGVLGVDTDAEALERLKAAVQRQGLEGRYRAVQGDVLAVASRADVVFFEFCLHEIVDPVTALRHARSLAPEVLVADHAPGSPWARLMLEAEKVLRGWTAVERFEHALDRTFPGVQRFGDHAELAAKLRPLGERVAERTNEFRDRRDFTIDMPYRVAVLGT